MDHQCYPLKKNLVSTSDDELVQMFSKAPGIYQHGCICKVVRISNELVMKGGISCKRGEGRTQKFAVENKFGKEKVHIRTPAVHRIFSSADSWFIVMDFVLGHTLKDLWYSMDSKSRDLMVKQVADMVNLMQSTTLNHISPGPVDGVDDKNTAWEEGPFFSMYGAGPFGTAAEMEAWYNHKRDISLKYDEASPPPEPFHFDRLVLTHQDIAPRNIIVEEKSGKPWLIDWSAGGIYPVGFEQASAALRGLPDKCDREFLDALLDKLDERCEKETRQLKCIAFGLTTGSWL